MLESGCSVHRGLTFVTLLTLAVAPVTTYCQPPGLRTAGEFVATDGAGVTLNPGDVVAVAVLGEPELTGKYKISPLGTISMMYNIRVQAAGLTTDELARRITEELRAMIKRPVVQVSLDVEASSRHVVVSGYVAEPGPIVVPFGGSVATAVLAAGTTPQSDLAHVRLTRVDQPPLVVNLEGVRTGDNPPATTPVQDGDVIYVPKLQEAEFSVFGMVVEPGVKVLDPADVDRLDVIRALNAAGGVKEGANLAQAVILRANGQTEQVNLQALLFQGDTSQNKRLQPGDSLIVRAADRITVAGEVVEPTSFLAPEPMPLLSVIAHGKGLTPQADMKRATVVRPEGPVTVDLEKLWAQGDLSQNVLVQPGESVIIQTRDPAEVLVVGAVEKPGAVDLHLARNPSVLQAVQTAIPKPTADLRRVVVHRVGAPEPILVDLKTVVKEGNLQANAPAVSGDLIFVPELSKVYAAGAFMVPGPVPLGDKMTAMELVGAAGGFRPDALPAKMRLIRPGKDGSAPQVANIDFGRLERGLETASIPLAEGDILYVPARDPNRRGWEWWRDALWSIAGLAQIFW